MLRQRQHKPVIPTPTTCSKDSKATRIRTAIGARSAVGALPAYPGCKADLRCGLHRPSPPLTRRPVYDPRGSCNEDRRAECDTVTGGRGKVLRGAVTQQT